MGGEAQQKRDDKTSRRKAAPKYASGRRSKIQTHKAERGRPESMSTAPRRSSAVERLTYVCASPPVPLRVASRLHHNHHHSSARVRRSLPARWRARGTGEAADSHQRGIVWPATRRTCGDQWAHNHEHAHERRPLHESRASIPLPGYMTVMRRGRAVRRTKRVGSLLDVIR